MSNTTIDVDDEACEIVMRRYGFATPQEAVNFALRSLAVEPQNEKPLSLEEARRLRGIGWKGDLSAMRESRS